MYRFVLAAVVTAMIVGTGCAGTRRTPETFYVHAESFRLFSLPLPKDDQAAAWEKYAEEVGAGGEIRTVTSTPADWTSLVGFMGNLFWFHRTTLSGVMLPPPEEDEFGALPQGEALVGQASGAL